MKKFDLFLPKPQTQPFDPDAESAFRGQVAYIEVVNPFCNGSNSHSLVKSGGRILLSHEATSAEECYDQIDSLIQDLKRLKIKARKRMKKIKDSD